MALSRRRLSRRELMWGAGAAALAGAAGSLVVLRRERMPHNDDATSPGAPGADTRDMAADLSHVHFTDDTASAGLNFIQSDASCGMEYFVEQVASGAAVFDANGDGFLDIYFPAPKPLGVCKQKLHGAFNHRLYLNDGKGRFTLSPNAFGGVETDYGIAAAVGDYDNDGHPDLYVCCYGKNKLFRNRGDGTFEDVTEKAGLEVGGMSTGAVWFDYDGDGHLDLYVLRYCEWTVDLNRLCNDAQGRPGYCEPRIFTPSTNRLFHNNGDGTFTDVTKKSGAAPDQRRSLGAVAVDFHRSGRLDLFVANDLGPNYMLWNQGHGRFRDLAAQVAVATGLNGDRQANMGVATGDYDNSGRLSVLVTTFQNEPFTLYRNDGETFVDASVASGIAEVTRPYLGFGTGFVDTCNRGLLDLFFADGHVNPGADHMMGQGHYKQHNLLLLNDGAGHFREAKQALPADDVRVHRGACFGSFTNNGKIDILVTAKNDRPTLLRNDSDAGNWLLLSLTNRWGCCTPVGARCVATVAGKQLTRVVLGGGSYGGSSDYRVHFGLGEAKQIDKLEITWMSGKVQTLYNVDVNKVMHIKEG